MVKGQGQGSSLRGHQGTGWANQAQALPGRGVRTHHRGHAALFSMEKTPPGFILVSI